MGRHCHRTRRRPWGRLRFTHRRWLGAGGILRRCVSLGGSRPNNFAGRRRSGTDMAVGKDIYLIGICGTGVGALAGLLKAQGHRVRGSDVHAYPPMSDKLREWGIPVLEGFDAAHLTPRPDLVIIGNVVRATNAE